MPGVSSIVQMRERRRGASRRSPLAKSGLGCATLLALALLALLFALLQVYTQVIAGLPSSSGLAALLEPPNGELLQPTRLYDKSGEIVLLTLRHPAAETSYSLEVQPGAFGPSPETEPGFSVSQHQMSEWEKERQAPASLVWATIAYQDPGFWSHPGFSLNGLEGGEHPTLAQRLVASLLLWQEPPGLEKGVRERVLAAQVTKTYGREKVLEWYLNSAQYGPLIYGADAAARVYFGKPASHLTLLESAALVAISDTPSIEPRDVRDITWQRTSDVLQAMVLQGMITPQEAAEASLPGTVPFAKQDDDMKSLAPAFTNLVLSQLSQQLNMERVRRGGLEIRTTLDYGLQKQADCAARVQADRLAGKTNGNGASLEDCPAARLLPTISNPADGQYSADVLLLDPRTGRIHAWSQTDPDGLDRRPPGTLVTPFIYLTAFSRGQGPATLAWDIPASLPTNLRDSARKAAFHGPVRLRTALANDYLAPALSLLNQMGSGDGQRTLRQFGVANLEVADLIQAGKDLSLSGGEASLLEMAQAYGILANQGVLAGQVLVGNGSNDPQADLEPVTVLSVKTVGGEVWLDCENGTVRCTPQTRPVVSPQLAYLVTNVLSDEASRWPSLGHPNPLEIGRPVAAKIGSTGSEANAWAMGYTPQIVGGVWVGRGNNGGSSGKGLSASGAAGLWHAVLQYAGRSLSPDSWSAPPGITRLDVCDPSGLLPTAECPTVVNEVFLEGNEPLQADSLYQSFEINRETGRLATIFTPRNLVEERVFLIVPQAAQDWLTLAGLPVPPKDYDVLYAPPTPSPEVNIAKPEMFAYVSGKVTLQGSASGPNLNSFRLQYGQGLNPKEWFQIGSDQTKGVQKGKLAEWDTTGLGGLYAIQLQVIRTDRKIETAAIHVTVDNIIPTVRILTPGEGEGLRDEALVLQAEASDDLQIGKVEFYVDNALVATLFESPYMISWKGTPGKHIFIARAYDLALNQAEAKVEFRIVK